jgi:molybdopterin-guanine dinucleotide biosynthesis protein A
MNRPGAIVLCGGLSRRMGWSKAWLPFGSERMLQRTVRLLREVAQPIVVVAAAGQELPDLPEDVRVAIDGLPGRGPLQGMAAGMEALSGRVDFAFATSTDAPFLKPAWIIRLMEFIGEHDIAIPMVGGFPHPLAALYRVSAVRPKIEQLLQRDQLRLSSLAGCMRTRIVSEHELREIDPDLETLRNLNDLESYEQALRDAGFGTDEQDR